MMVKGRIKEWFIREGKRKAREWGRELRERQREVQRLLKRAGEGREVREELMEAKRKVEEWFGERERERIFLARAP